MAAQGKLDELIDKLIERMEQENYISSVQPGPKPIDEANGQVGNAEGPDV